MISGADAVDVDALFIPLSADEFIGSDGIAVLVVAESSCGEFILFSVIIFTGAVVDGSRTVVC